MKPRLKTSPAARELIKRFEPFRPQAEQGDDGRWVVGYGHRAAARSGVRVNEDEAALLLIYDVMRAEEVVDDSITGPLSRGQRDALTSFVHDVGVDSFRRSDVARFLFEGRARAAGEALAAYGDGTSSRREAESRLFLDALLPAQSGKARKSEPVELVIKIEHPTEERVLEGAISGAEAPPPEPGADLPPPPPPFDAGLARRREAEDEIARILATVEALPPEVRRELGETEMAPVAEAVSEMRDDPIETRYEAVDDEPDAGVAEPEAESEPVAEEVEAEAEPAAEADPEAAADRVIARMAEEIAEVGSDPAAVPETDGAPVETPVADQATAETGMTGEEPSDDRPAPVAAPLAAFDLPDGMGLGFVLTDRQAGTTAVEAETAPAVPASTETEQSVPEHYALDLPAGMGLGYAFTSIMQGRFHVVADEVAAEPVEAADTAAAVAADPGESLVDASPEANAGPDMVEEVEPDLEAQGDADVEPGAELQPVSIPDDEIVERAVALTGDDTPPPHPAETPAEAQGAVGDVEGEPAADGASDHAPVDDDGHDDPMMAGHDPMSEDADEFTPRDLAADVHATTPRPGPRSDDGMWTFIAVLVAGGLLAGFGSVLAAAEWDYIMAQREMTLNFGMALAGFFLVIVAGWQLASIWLSKLKQKASD
ncbi:glycoside hydrolase family protein [Maricaulis sp.]|uniref:glycoside hydrolase family protein n=1 Tax=Maricaulis sp. TaxID=1486257 RepID=UPI003A8DD4F2